MSSPRCFVCHLDWEERNVFPVLARIGYGELVRSLLADHERYRVAVERGATIPPHDLMLHAIEEETALGTWLLPITSGPEPHGIDGRLYGEIAEIWHEVRRDHVAIEGG